MRRGPAPPAGGRARARPCDGRCGSGRARRAGGVRAGDRVAALSQTRSDRGQRVAAGEHGGALAGLALGQRGQLALLGAGFAAGVADEVQHAGVRALDALDERQRLEQLREAVGVQDDGDEVRAAAHVALAQQAGELVADFGQPGAQAGDAAAGGGLACLRGGEPGLGLVEVLLGGAQPAFEDRDLARGLALELAEPLGGVGQRTLTLLAGPDAVAQRPLVLGERHRHEEQDGKDQQHHAAHRPST